MRRKVKLKLLKPTQIWAHLHFSLGKQWFMAQTEAEWGKTVFLHRIRLCWRINPQAQPCASVDGGFFSWCHLCTVPCPQSSATSPGFQNSNNWRDKQMCQGPKELFFRAAGESPAEFLTFSVPCCSQRSGRVFLLPAQCFTPYLVQCLAAEQNNAPPFVV